jgi:integrase
MRPGELAGLRVEDLDLEGHVVQVYQSIWEGKPQPPKNSRAVRRMAISSELSRHLQTYLLSWRPNSLNLVFTSENGTALNPSNVGKRHLGRLLDRLGIKRRGLKAFRHASATMMDRLNTPPATKQERMGHSPGSPVTMLHYIHPVAEDNRRVAQQMGAIFGATG